MKPLHPRDLGTLKDRMSERMPEDIPDKMPEDMPDRMPEDMPDRMPEGMSDRMPEDLPVTKCINVMVGITRSKVMFFFHAPGAPGASTMAGRMPKATKRILIETHKKLTLVDPKVITSP